MINGNLEGIKDSVLNQIELIYEYAIEKDSFISKEVVAELCHFTDILEREISIYVNRKGRIVDISLGSNDSVSLFEYNTRRSDNGLTGIRCIHTHPNGNGNLSNIDLNTLAKLRFDGIASIGVSNGSVSQMYCAIPKTENGQLSGDFTIYGPYNHRSIEAYDVMQNILELHKKISIADFHENTEIEERVILVGVQTNSTSIDKTCMESLDELEKLAQTAGAITFEKVIQHRSKAEPGLYVGKGKAQELARLKQELNANMIIFDDELSGAQIRNLEQIISAKVIDRTTLILDIFAKHASSREGKIQIELAQLRYRLPRLLGLGINMSRMGGGIGSKGPGEKKLETDKRHINRRILYLEKELKEIAKQRDLKRSQREKSKIPTVALVGYTNSGKSTLMNSLSSANVLAQDKLFATLDPTVRKITLDNGQDILLIDTVGFIRKLPHHLIQAFQSTLEETVHSDVLLHIIDSSSEEFGMQRDVVLNLLENINASDKPMIMVYNKIDLLDEEILKIPDHNFIKISAKNNMGLEELLNEIIMVLPEKIQEINLLLPYSEGNIVSLIHENGKVIEEEYTNDGIKLKAYLNNEMYNRYSKYIME